MIYVKQDGLFLCVFFLENITDRFFSSEIYIVLHMIKTFLGWSSQVIRHRWVKYHGVRPKSCQRLHNL